ncbi:MAG TPA: hypothetical protein VF192_07145 [Longimicrobiales bacterium]
MIDAAVFAKWIRVLAERIGKSLSAEAAAVYYATLSAELDTAQFETAMQRIFRDHGYATWPSPKAIIETVRPPKAFEAAAAWTALQNVIRLRPANAQPHEVRAWIARDAGEAAAVTFEAIGGLRRYLPANEWRLDEMRSDFVERLAEVDRVMGNGHTLPPAMRALLPERT